MVLKRRPPEDHGERRSSAGKRRQSARKLEKDLEGTQWEKPKGKKS